MAGRTLTVNFFRIGTDQEIVIFRDGGTYNVGLQPREGLAEPAAGSASAAQPFMAGRGWLAW
jgi:hypothetical protein